MKTKYSDRELGKIASSLSGEEAGFPGLTDRFIAEESDVVKAWNEMKDMKENFDIDVDKAWNKVSMKIENEEEALSPGVLRLIPAGRTLLRIAAAALILVAIGTTIVVTTTGTRKITVATNSEQVNFRVSLPDGSNIYLNRNSKLTYNSSFGKHSRNVELAGEGFFEISPDASRPFIIDAGKAKVRVVGTSFNVITSNPEYAVEVFVRTGKVMLSDSSGSRSMLLEPGFIGTMDSKASEKKINSNLNYLGWHNRKLEYQGQTLAIIFNDLKRVYNMDVVADDPSILNETWTVTIDNKSEDTIIRIICEVYNLGSTKVGNVYHLARK